LKKNTQSSIIHQSVKIFLDGKEISFNANDVWKIPRIESQSISLDRSFLFTIEEITFTGNFDETNRSLEIIAVNERLTLHFTPAINTAGWKDENFLSNLVQNIFSRVSLDFIKNSLALV
jgi:hypothetical protein